MRSSLLFGAFLFCQRTVSSMVSNVCVTGFVMDLLCIDLQVLLDNRSLRTLSNPDRHTIHCLVDVPGCELSGYEVLSEPRLANGDYTRAYRLDAAGNTLVLAEARRVGVCSTCDGTGSQVRGFRATLLGNEDPTYTGTPPLLNVLEIHPDTVDCATLLANGTATGSPMTPAPMAAPTTSESTSSPVTSPTTTPALPSSPTSSPNSPPPQSTAYVAASRTTLYKVVLVGWAIWNILSF